VGTVRIEADLLVPGRGPPVPDGVVVLDGPVITFAGPAAGAPARRADEDLRRVETVLPGLWDCHVHLLGTRSADPAALLHEPVELRAARCVADLGAALRAGFTSVREAGGFGARLAPLVAEATVAGPRLHAAGAFLSTTGGHGDLCELPLGLVRQLARTEPTIRLCDGVDDCTAAVREQLRDGAEVIKVFASGGTLSSRGDPHEQQFTDAELRAVVEVAGLAGRAVMAHAHGAAAALAAVEAGVRTIEHGTWLDDEACAAMAAHDVLLVPTLLVGHELLAPGASDDLAPVVVERMREVASAGASAVARAHAAGVRIALGTDVMVSGSDRPLGWGRHGRELPLLVAAGLTPLEAIEAATANGPATLGARAPRSGQLRAGHDADVLAVRGDPTGDVGVLADPANVDVVWRGGRRVVDEGRLLPPC